MSKTVSHLVNGIERALVIRRSNNRDIREIHDWLLEEDAQGVHGNFLCNWNLTYQCHEEGSLLVIIDETEGRPVAYHWGMLLSSGILQVRNEYRGKGLGRLIVEHCVELAIQQDEMVLQVECKPSSSIPFWEAMGFTIIPGDFRENPKGFRTLSKKMALPSDGRPASVMLKVFPEERKWKEDTPAVASFSLDAVITSDEKVYLAERVSFPDRSRTPGRDPVIEIAIGGQLLYRDKAKYQGAQNHGLNRCRNGFYIDTISMRE